MSVFEHSDLGLAQALKHIIAASLSNHGLMPLQQVRLLTLKDMKQAHDFARIAGQELRTALGLPGLTSQIVVDWEKLRQTTAITNKVNHESALLAARMHSELKELHSANQTKLSSPFAYISQDKIFQDDAEINGLVGALKSDFERNAVSISTQFGETQRGGTTPQNYTGIGIGISARPHEGKPTVRIYLFRNSSHKKSSDPIDVFCVMLGGLFKHRINFEVAHRRWAIANASVVEAVDSAVFSQNYFTKNHNHLRPGLSIKASNGRNGSMTGTFSSVDFKNLYAKEMPSFKDGNLRFLVTCKHVAFDEPGVNGGGKIERPWVDGSNKIIASILQPQSDIPWWVSFGRDPYDIAFAVVDHEVRSSSSVVGVASQDFAMRLPKHDELDGLLEKEQEVVLLGSSGAVKGTITDIDVDAAYIFRANTTVAFLPATGLRVARSTNRKIGRAGNSGGPVVLDRYEGKPGQSDNVIIGVRVAGDEGLAVSGLNDRNAPSALYQPIAATFETLMNAARILERRTEDLEVDGRSLDDAARQSDDVQSFDGATQKVVDAFELQSSREEHQRYSSDVKNDYAIDQGALSALKKEVRRRGGLITATSLHPSSRDEALTIEFQLANSDVSSELVAFADSHPRGVNIEFVAGRKFYRALNA